MKNYKLSSRISNLTESSIRNTNPSVVKISQQDFGDLNKPDSSFDVTQMQ